MSAPLTTASSVDPADAAGGEVIFSSDGMDPLPPPIKPPTLVSGDEEKEVVLDSSNITAQTAFEVFQGKLYYPPPGTNSHRNNVAASSDDPLATLARLTQEVEVLEQQLKMSFSSTKAEEGREFDDACMTLALGLKERLAQSQQAASSLSSPKEQETLTRLISQQVQTLAKKGTTTAAAADQASGTTTGVVYELYGTATNPTTTLEERIVGLERLLGSGSDSSTSITTATKPSSKSTTMSSKSQSMTARLERLEGLLSSVDASQLEATALSAKLIRADLEAASKARNKLAATYKKEDSKLIQQLHQQMVDLEGLSSHLPALVERLSQLSTLHVQSATFGQRLQALEGSAQQVTSTVGEMERTLEQVQSTMVTNLQTMESNWNQLDQRLAK